MNELNTRLLEYLPDPNTVKGGIGGVIETLQTEAPLLVNEILRWNFTISMLWCLLWLGVSCIIARSWYKNALPQFAKWAKEEKNDDKAAVWFVFAIITALCMLPLMGMLSSTWWLEIIIAPRLFLIEYISNLT